MNKRILKRLRDKMPESLKYIAGPFIRKKLTGNEVFRNNYDLLIKRESLSPDQIRQYQFDRLKVMLIHSHENVPYYTQLFREIDFNPHEFKSFDELKRIPFLTKQIIRDNFTSLTSIQSVRGGSYTTTTSGSTGEPLKLILDYESFFKERAFHYYYYRKLGYHFEDKLVTFRGIDFGGKTKRYNPVNNETIFSPFKLSQHTIGKYLRDINKIRPAYLNGYFSTIYYFARLLADSNQTLDFKLKGIFLISENIDETERLFVESFYGVPTMSYYGHTERCVLAQEFNHNEYLFDPYYGYTEQINLDVESFEIVGTGFLNMKMPLIRYRTGDLCRITGENMISISGRRYVNDFLVGFNDEQVFNSTLHILSDILIDVTKYQFVQDRKGYATMLLIPGKNFKYNETQYIEKEINRQLEGSLIINIKITDQLMLSPRGKYSLFISSIR